MPKNSASLLVLFADVVGSTRLYEKLGNIAAQSIISECMSILAQVAHRFGGTVVKTIGDEALCTFENLDQAGQSAGEMHLTLRHASIENRFSSQNLTVRIGTHFGQVIRNDNDVFGDAVNVAARVVALSKSQQTLTTKQTLDVMGPELRSIARFVDQTRIKGRTEQLDLYELIWDPKGLTLMEGMPPEQPSQKQLHLRIGFGATEIKLGQERPLLTIGRDNQNDFVVEGSKASRLHARIEFRRNRFVLVDQSINGTYVQIQGGPTVHLRRDEMELRGDGTIVLGHAHDTETKECIHFSHKA